MEIYIFLFQPNGWLWCLNCKPKIINHMRVYIFLILSILVTTFGCNESNSVLPSDQCFEVSYITGICGQAVLKIENPAFFELGETWNGNENVFYTVFDCSVDESELDQSNFFVRIKQDTVDTNCIRCLATIDYQGSKQYLVDIVDDCSIDSSK